jgi:hypothetical protein
MAFGRQYPIVGVSLQSAGGFSIEYVAPSRRTSLAECSPQKSMTILKNP